MASSSQARAASRRRRRGASRRTVEVAWALILAVVKRVTIEDRAIRAGALADRPPANLGGATLGLAGLGQLGAR